MTPHPQRCETCTNPKCEHAVKDGYFSPRKKFAWKHTLQWGCASHSSQQSEPKFTKNCVCNKYTNCTDCQKHDDEIRQSEQDKVLKSLKKDLQTRFVSSSNQWSEGRNSGLLECCNIIDEELLRWMDAHKIRRQ